MTTSSEKVRTEKLVKEITTQLEEALNKHLDTCDEDLSLQFAVGKYVDNFRETPHFLLHFTDTKTSNNFQSCITLTEVCGSRSWAQIIISKMHKQIRHDSKTNERLQQWMNCLSQ